MFKKLEIVMYGMSIAIKSIFHLQ